MPVSGAEFFVGWGPPNSSKKMLMISWRMSWTVNAFFSSKNFQLKDWIFVLLDWTLLSIWSYYPPGTLNNHCLVVVSIGWFQTFTWEVVGNHHFHPLKTGCLGYQASIIQYKAHSQHLLATCPHSRRQKHVALMFLWGYIRTILCNLEEFTWSWQVFLI